MSMSPLGNMSLVVFAGMTGGLTHNQHGGHHLLNTGCTNVGVFCETGNQTPQAAFTDIIDAIF